MFLHWHQRVPLIIYVTACRRAAYLSVLLSVAHLTCYYSRHNVIDIMTTARADRAFDNASVRQNKTVLTLARAYLS